MTEKDGVDTMFMTHKIYFIQNKPIIIYLHAYASYNITYFFLNVYISV